MTSCARVIYYIMRVDNIYNSLIPLYNAIISLCNVLISLRNMLISLYYVLNLFCSEYTLIIMMHRVHYTMLYRLYGDLGISVEKKIFRKTEFSAHFSIVVKYYNSSRVGQLRDL